MNASRLPLRHLNRALPPTTVLRTTTQFRIPAPQLLQAQARLHSGAARPLPKIAQPSFWNSLIPKFIRNRFSRQTRPYKPKSKEWNPASFYIIIFILIGSQAIRMIALKNDYSAYTRSTDAKIRLLREVIEKVNNGEKVDVEKLLGTGDGAKEREWEEVLREIEAEDSLWHRKNAREESEQQSQQNEGPDQSTKDSVVPAEGLADEAPPANSNSRKKLNFF
ncbi:hypothetical protein BO71DRAFT_410278 [Aspergillus ellipticus CBS 707.79]|uniref:Uncharacterized protein n=1 Tax=Aspergillus ellipticus CBS 707.79 TaxID=1448320 RepID=A0A319DPX2_9EURO|nr:hypothetical protein BO71DRAFT_410278 [Aspergillus ellipticus CBS 707.79]